MSEMSKEMFPENPIKSEEQFKKNLIGEKIGKVNMNRLVMDYRELIENLKTSKSYDIKKERVYLFMIEDLKNLPEKVLENPVLKIGEYTINLDDFRNNFDEAIENLKKDIIVRQSRRMFVKKLFLNQVLKQNIDQSQKYYATSMVNTFISSLFSRFDLYQFSEEEIKNNSTVIYDKNKNKMEMRFKSHATRFKIRINGEKNDS